MKAIFLKFRKNDLTPSSGKQIEFSKEYSSEFFELTTPEATVEFTYKSLVEEKACDGEKIKVVLKLSPSRGDYKVYQNGEGDELSLKTFLRENLKLSEERNSEDYLVISKQSRDSYLFSYIPKDSPYYELLTSLKIDRLYGSGAPYSEVMNAQKNPIQTIYFGAPGSGKSHKVAEDLAGISRENIFRTTFHPDYDYASFVGCYKPEMRSEPIWEESYTFDELLAIIPNEVRVGENYPVEKFCLRHYRSIEKLNISSSQKNELRVKILQAAKNSDEQQAEGKTIQTATVLAGAALGRYLEDNGILSASGNNTTIAYAFTPQVFTNAYVRAWEHPNEKVYLVIEEINRGNCAQIFGDLFQLLDRKDDGTSCYSIRADKDLADYLQHALSGDAKRGIEEGNLCLPSNLHIIATMNTSDQSLFPMDSAFKRRWDWEYVPINYKEAKSSGFKITIGEKSYLWIKFLEHVNGKVWDLTKSEDKQMGNFFIKGNITEEVFKSKVMAYLWHEICKDEYGATNYFFCTEKGYKFSFNQLYNKDSSPSGTELLQGFMTYLEVPVIGEESAGEENE
ncbi:MAG: AAA family ATPase [Porphyromonas pasteri]